MLLLLMSMLLSITTSVHVQITGVLGTPTAGCMPGILPSTKVYHIKSHYTVKQ